MGKKDRSYKKEIRKRFKIFYINNGRGATIAEERTMFSMEAHVLGHHLGNLEPMEAI